MSFKIQCKDCGKIYLASGTASLCTYCGGNKRNYNKICKDCDFKWISDNAAQEICPNCGGNRRAPFKMKKERKCHLTCKVCGFEYIGGSAKAKCPKCEEESLESESVKLFKKLIKQGWKILNDHVIITELKFGKLKAKKICPTCNREFSLNFSSQKYCGCCDTYRICKNCHKNYLTSNKENGFCSIRCSDLFRHKNETFFGTDVNPNKNNFYENDTKIFIPKHTKIENYNDYNIPGIWYKYDPDKKEVLDVLLTTNIKDEIEYHFKQLGNKTKHKFIEMSKLDNIEFYYLCNFETWEEGLEKELNFALETNAKYWSPSPGDQSILYKKIKDSLN